MERYYFTADEGAQQDIEEHRENLSQRLGSTQSRAQAIANLVHLGLKKAAEERKRRKG